MSRHLADLPRRRLMLAFDHRGLFNQLVRESGFTELQPHGAVVHCKRLLLQAALRVAEAPGPELQAPPHHFGVFIDEQYGAMHAWIARDHGLTLAMPVEQSDSAAFHLEFGSRFGEHLAHFMPDYAKVLVHYDSSSRLTEDELVALRTVSEWCQRSATTEFLFELLLSAPEPPAGHPPATAAAAEQQRLGHTVAAIEWLYRQGIEPTVWKVEGGFDRAGFAALADTARSGGRDHVSLIVLGGGRSLRDAAESIRAAAEVEGFIGFAVGRTIWSDPLRSRLSGLQDDEETVQQIADRYTRLVRAYLEGEATRVGQVALS
ncbi:2-deoxy-5-keto-D-gluconate 6-phosphate aldolase domain-containing protein [Nonomuraea sp. NPDC026600]|uniref:2-deoxy-5-keto-D-gluconate 6-phosphate aldolase domain-containing protein n=1 Tax=Nonomuraea sp. NPDC026600 TaxID=3155363 RepID=UPI0033C7FACD